MSEDLKPCPFCGHWAAFHFDKPEQPAEIWVECENSECMAEVRALTGTKKFAAEHWNKRATTEPKKTDEELVEAKDQRTNGVTITMPAELWDAHVALQRTVDDGLEPDYSRGEVACSIPEMFELYAIADACLAVKQQLNNTGGAGHD